MSRAKITGKNQITIPSKVMKDLNLSVGDKIDFIKTEHNSFEIKKASEVKCAFCNESILDSQDSINIRNESVYHTNCWHFMTDKEHFEAMFSKHIINEKVLGLIDKIKETRNPLLFYGIEESYLRLGIDKLSQEDFENELEKLLSCNFTATVIDKRNMRDRLIILLKDIKYADGRCLKSVFLYNCIHQVEKFEEIQPGDIIEFNINNIL